MDFYILTLFFILFTLCLVYPPTELLAAGFTIPQIFDSVLGSENRNFVAYHMLRIIITTFLHSMLPLTYFFYLWCGGIRWPFLVSASAAAATIPLSMLYKIITWWENDQKKHPAVQAFLPYVTEGIDWRVVASRLNVEFSSVDKVCVPLSTTSKLIATESWIIKVTQYNVQAIRQNDCTLVATACDLPTFQLAGEEEVQYLNIDVIPTRDDIKGFKFRISTSLLRDLQMRLIHPVRVPEHISLLPSMIERFITVFKHCVDQNPVYYVEEALEQCIGCMQAQADVKLNRRCAPPPPGYTGPQICQTCNCRALWCCTCIARWWAARARGSPSEWLSGRCTCPVCRATFCLLDVVGVANEADDQSR